MPNFIEMGVTYLCNHVKHTILIPCKAVSKLLSLKLHIKSDWDKKLRLVGILMYCCWIKVVITRIHIETKLTTSAAVKARTAWEDNYQVAESLKNITLSIFGVSMPSRVAFPVCPQLWFETFPVNGLVNFVLTKCVNIIFSTFWHIIMHFRPFSAFCNYIQFSNSSLFLVKNTTSEMKHKATFLKILVILAIW